VWGARPRSTSWFVDALPYKVHGPRPRRSPHAHAPPVVDLVGLPPTPQEVDAFVSDEGPDAYERLVDRLLASPHYGERMAQAWLDLVRYADTIGYHSDNPQSVWPYRDYVIKSFNDNKPFDQFTVEQLASDLLPESTQQQPSARASIACC
jgi:hypothetical protein